MSKLKPLSTRGSVRRLARLWVDLSDKKRKELLQSLATDDRIAVIERISEIKKEREKNDD